MHSTTAPFADFADASREVLRFLKQAVPLGAWIVSRIQGNDYVVLAAEDAGFGVRPGDTLPAADTLCMRMIAGAGPNLAPDVQAVPAYREALSRYPTAVGAYVGFPVPRSDGSVFGTLCAIDLCPKDEQLLHHRELIALLARQLATILQFDLQREDLWRRAVQGEAQSMTDALTGVLNRRGWDLMCAREEAHCRSLGDPLGVLQIDLDGLKAVNDREGHEAGDRLIRRAAECLQRSLPASATLARTGGDEYSVLLPAHDALQSAAQCAALRAALSAAGIAASLGAAQRKPWRDIAEAWKRADAAMYADKRQRQDARG